MLKHMMASAFALALMALPAHAKKVTLASSAPNSGINKVFVETFSAELKKQAPGLELEVFLDSQLGAERELTDLVRIGETSIHMGVIHSSQYYPELDATLVPYLFQTYDGVKAFLAGPIGKKMEDALRQKGNAVTLGYYYQGARWTSARNKSFETVDELKGVKIRMPKIPLWIDIWSGLGATIAPMPSKEVFSAMQAGVIDAQENMLSNIWGRRIYEVSTHLIATKHQQSYMTIMANQNFWQKLTDAERTAVKAAIDAGTKAADAAATALNDKIVKDIVAKGVKLVEPKPAFREAALPVVEKASRAILAPGVWDEAVKASK